MVARNSELPKISFYRGLNRLSRADFFSWYLCDMDTHILALHTLLSRFKVPTCFCLNESFRMKALMSPHKIVIVTIDIVGE